MNLENNPYLSRIPREDIPHLKALSENYKLASTTGFRLGKRVKPYYYAYPTWKTDKSYKGLTLFLVPSATDSEDWATNLGKYYVSLYGRPTEWDIYFGIGASLIQYFSKEQP